MKKIAAMLICVFLLGTQIIDFEFQKGNNQIVITYRKPVGYLLPEDGGPPDKVWKEIYGVEDGRIFLLKRTEGKYIPPMWIEEKIIFDELE